MCDDPLTHAAHLSSRSLRSPPVVGAPSPDAAAQPRCCRRPRRRCCRHPRRPPVAGSPDTPPLSAALSHCCSTHGMLKARPVCRARTHRRAREIWCLGRVWHTLSSAHDRPFRQPAPAAIAALTGPCLAQNTTTPKTRQRRAARARRAALAVTRPCQHRSSSRASCAAPCRRGQEERDDEGRHLNFRLPTGKELTFVANLRGKRARSLASVA